MPNSKRKSHCGKAAFKTLLSAQIAASKMVIRHKKKDPIITGLDAYKCNYCGKFHIGKSIAKGINWDALNRYDEKIKEQCELTKRNNTK